MSQLADALFPRTRQKVLGILFAQPERQIHLRELARLAGVSPSSIQRELHGLVTAGILLKEARGSLQEFRANPACPVFEELCGFARKTYGVADVIREAIADLPIRIAVIFGSVARGEEKANSDIDVLAVGEDGYRELLGQLKSIEHRLGRPINVKYYKPAEFHHLIASGDPFALEILRGPKIFLKGDDHGFEALQPDHDVERRHAQSAHADARRTQGTHRRGRKPS